LRARANLYQSTPCRPIVCWFTIYTALDIQERYSFSWYDSLIVATALEAGYDSLYCEDMQNGQEIGGRLRITNPFV
jgi:predicted nucleic acid-binding protein